jgi:glycosyltransferase involved in cell wall biosynthesis
MSAAIINVCEAERALAQRYRIAADSKLAVIHNGVVDVDPHFHAQPGTSPVRLIMVARFEVQKDHATLLHALAALQELDWSLELVGDGPTMPAAHALTAYLGLSSRVHFAGSDDNVAARLATAQIFVLSSVFEGFPLSTLEAMRAGLPVVASDVGGVREAVVDGQTGAVVPPRNPAALAAALRPLILNPSLRVQQGRAGRQVYESNFTFEQMLEKTLSVYDSALPVGATEVSLQQTRNGHVDPEHVQTKPLKESARGL